MQFDFRLTSNETSSTTALYTYLRKALPPLLKEKFNAFRPALIAAYGGPSADTPSGSSTPNPAGGQSQSYAPAPPGKDAGAATKKTEEKASGSKVNNVATVEVKATLQASADDIWGLLTDENRIPMWSRSPAKVIHDNRLITCRISSKLTLAQLSLTPGSPFELFGGNVVGKVQSAEAPTKLVQSWQSRSPSWPSGQ